ncbi:MAG: hypothetical protein J2P39_09570 [Candidatus Dormibacteraeota bacterium]|nr:hypothetical protein [Candidatus Dormibacteraeota bacterium]
MSQRYLVRHNDGPEVIEVDGRVSLTLADVQGVIKRHRYYFEQANNPEPYAPWGLSVVELIEDEDGVIEKPVNWRELELQRRQA